MTTLSKSHEENEHKSSGVQQEAVKRFLQGWQVIPLHVGEKRPIDGGWPDQRFENEDEVREAFPPEDSERNQGQRNLGVVLGGKSRLICVDLDAADPRVAALALPTTGLLDGRPGSPDSHPFYQLEGRGGIRKEQYVGSLAERPLVEILGDAHQVVLPPSRYSENGESRAWSLDGEPARVRADELPVGGWQGGGVRGDCAALVPAREQA